MSKKSSGFLMGMIVGGTAAATAAILLTPKSGKEIYSELIAHLDGATEGKVSHYLEIAKEITAVENLNKETTTMTDLFQSVSQDSSKDIEIEIEEDIILEDQHMTDDISMVININNESN